MRIHISNRLLTSALIGSAIIPMGFLIPSMKFNITSAIMGQIDSSIAHRTILPLAVLIVSIFLLNIKNLKFPKDILSLSIYISFLFFTASHILNLTKGSSTIHYIDNLLFILFYLSGYNIARHNINDDNSLRKAMLFFCIISSSIYIALIFVNPGDIAAKIQNTGKAISEYRNQTPIILYSIIYLFAINSNKKDKYTKTAIAMIIIFALLSWSRTGFLFITLIFLFSILSGRASLKTRVLITITALALITQIELIIGTLKSISDNIFILDRLFKTGEEGDLNRLSLLKKGWSIMLDSPFLGHGFTPMDHLEIGSEYSLSRTFSPHNQFVDFGIKTGLIGFSWFILMNIGLFFHLLRSKTKLASKFAFVWLAVMLSCFTQNLLFNYTGYFLWMIMGICIYKTKKTIGA